MTTPTLREAAEYFNQELKAHDPDTCTDAECYRCRWFINMRVLVECARAIADAQSDAGKAAEKFVNTYDYSSFLRPKDDEETGTLGYMMRQDYLAGHAQGYAAGLAAQEAKARELEVKINARPANQSHGELDVRWQELVAMHDDQMRRAQAAEAALATAKADALELANQVRRMWKREECEIRSAYDPHQWHARDNELKQLQSDRPAAVTAAMERYK